ncbi:MAG TPA: metal-sensitive transcriptional regulator [Vicinamibacterales bacterium]|nr:metal-sensitive transcriptional regulator [Vicinamibacterales bacterium]
MARDLPRRTPNGARELQDPGPAQVPTCGCAVQESGRTAVAVDPDIKASNLTRLRRIEGQVRGLQKMVEADRYCADILAQISSVQEALRGVGRELLRNHLRHCVTDTLRRDGAAEREAIFDELIGLFDRQRA